MQVRSQIRKENGKYAFYVDGKPFIALGGELHNSSASSLDYMERVVWPSLRPLKMNTVFAPVYWECVEPEPGVFDFELVDGLIDQVRREGIKLVLLWFGLWKNGMSQYVPEWVKADTAKFFRMRTVSGEPIESISPLCEAAVDADAKAFTKLMAHIREFDSDQGTAIMMQVENEIGVLGADRDYSEAADRAFRQTVPEKVATAYGVSGTWEQAFGKNAPELFMGYHFASATEKIAAAGSAEYPIPMYVNAWLERYPWLPGTYPSGGPQAKIMKMWKVCAPTIALCAPDNYADNFRDVCDEYVTEDNPLFIPETRTSLESSSFVFYAVGKHYALGFSPFAIETLFWKMDLSPEEEPLRELNVPFYPFGKSPAAGPLLAKSYELISSMIEVIHKAHMENRIHGFLQQNDMGELIELKNYDIKINYTGTFIDDPVMIREKKKTPAAGFMIELSDDEFIFAGVGYSVEILPKPGEKAAVRLLRKEDGKFVDNRWVRDRILNGDEARATRLGAIPSIVRIKMYKVL